MAPYMKTQGWKPNPGLEFANAFGVLSLRKVNGELARLIRELPRLIRELPRLIRELPRLRPKLADLRGD